MFKKLRLKRKLLIFSIPILILVSAAALYTNGVFYFSEFKPSVQVQYTFEDSSKLKELLTNTSQLNNVASVDRTNNIVEFEGESFSNVKSNIQNITSNYAGVIFTVKEISALRKGSLVALIAAIYLLSLAGIAIHFYFISGKGGDIKIIIGAYAIYLKYLSIATFISLGLLSIISRFYKITSLDLLLVLIAAIFSYLIFYVSASNLFEVKSFQNFGYIIKNFINKNLKTILFASIVLLGVTAIGLGIAFVINAILLFVFILFSLFEFYWTGFLLEEWKILDNSLYSRVNSIRKFRIRKSKQVINTTPSKKKDHAKGQAGKKKKKKK